MYQLNLISNQKVYNNQNISTFKTSSRPFHPFIKAWNSCSLTAWERFKNIFRCESQNVVYLKKLLAQKKINWAEVSLQNQLGTILSVANSYSLEAHLLKALLKRCDPDQLKPIFENAFDKIYASSNFDFEKILKFLDAETVCFATGCKNIEEKIQEMAKCLPENTLKCTVDSQSQLGKTFRVALRFFPNFMDTVLKAFSLIDAGRGPQTVWDYSAMIGIYFSIFTIPYSVFVIVSSLVSTPLYILLTTLAVIGTALVGISVYLKYRPCPSRISMARNLSEEAERGMLAPVIGRELDIFKMSSFLGKKKNGFLTNLILVGKSGIGKTELVKGFAQKYKEKKIFLLNAPELASANSYSSFGDKLRSMLLDIKGYENEVIFFIEEFGDAVAKKLITDVAGCLKPLLQRDGVQVIATATSEEYEEILKDNPLEERFIKFDVSVTKKQVLEILQDRIESKGNSILFEEGVAEKIFEKTQNETQPRGSVKLLELAMNRVNAFDSESYVPEKLKNAYETIKEQKKSYESALEKNEETSDFFNAISKSGKKIAKLEKDAESMRIRAKKIKCLIERRRLGLLKRRELAKGKLNRKHLSFLHWILLPWLDKMIKKEKEDLKGIPLTVDNNLIATI